MFKLSNKSVKRAISAVVGVCAVLALLFYSPYPVSAFASPLPVNLGVAANYAVLADTTVTNTATPTIVTGDVGLDSPGVSITGFTIPFPGSTLVQGPTSTGLVAGPGTVLGTIHIADTALLPAPTTTSAAQAQVALIAAYGDVAGRGVNAAVVAQLGGQSLGPGVYSVGAALLTAGNLTLTGNATDVFIFQIATTLTTAGPSQVILVGASAANVFFQVGSSATLGGGTVFRGNILALTNITLNGGTTVSGRLLALNGFVTLDNNTVSLPPAPPVVGGEAYPINKAQVLVPWLILALIIVIGGSVLVLRRSTSH